MAIESGSGAISLEMEAERFERSKEQSNTIAQILRLQAGQVRNDGVADSMQAWFYLLKTCLQHDVLIASSSEIHTTEEIVNRLREKGLASTVDLESFDRQQLGLDDKQAVLAAGQQDVTDILELLLQIRTDTQHPLVPDPNGLESWRPLPTPELENAVAVAWANRKDLALLKRLSESQDVKTLDAIRKSLAEVHPLLSSAIERNFASGPIRKLRLKRRLEQELDSRRGQICDVLDQIKSKIRLQVGEAIHAIERHETGVRLRQESIASIDRSLELLEKSAKIRQVELDEQTELKSQRLELEAELVEQLIERELAWVRLLKAQGLLAQQYNPPMPLQDQPLESTTVTLPAGN